MYVYTCVFVNVHVRVRVISQVFSNCRPDSFRTLISLLLRLHLLLPCCSFTKHLSLSRDCKVEELLLAYVDICVFVNCPKTRDAEELTAYFQVSDN